MVLVNLHHHRHQSKVQLLDLERLNLGSQHHRHHRRQRHHKLYYSERLVCLHRDMLLVLLDHQHRLRDHLLMIRHQIQNLVREMDG